MYLGGKCQFDISTSWLSFFEIKLKFIYKVNFKKLKLLKKYLKFLLNLSYFIFPLSFIKLPLSFKLTLFVSLEVFLFNSTYLEDKDLVAPKVLYLEIEVDMF